MKSKFALITKIMHRLFSPSSMILQANRHEIAKLCMAVNIVKQYKDLKRFQYKKL